MREILFRGKVKQPYRDPFQLLNDGWAYGYYTYSNETGKHYILIPNLIAGKVFDMYEVEPESVGQCTGLQDKNGNKIFEGDICRIYFDIEKVEDRIYVSLTDEEINTGTKIFKVESPIFNTQDEFTAEVIEVIGNIYENPELLEVENAEN